MLLYGAECWVPLQRDVRRLSSSYTSCIRSILGITRRDIWQTHLADRDFFALWGDQRPLPVLLMQCRLEWLGHVARMPDERIPKRLLFGLLRARRPPGGPRKRGRDCVRADLKCLDALDGWYALAQSCPAWHALYSEYVSPPPVARTVSCDFCHGQFSLQSDLRCHKCLVERMLPIEQQSGAVLCDRCDRWFRSAGGYAVHRCSPSSSTGAAPSQSLQRTSTSCNPLQCQVCQRTFKSNSGLTRHKCVRASRPAVGDRDSFTFVCECGRKFRRQQDLLRHRRFCS